MILPAQTTLSVDRQTTDKELHRPTTEKKNDPSLQPYQQRPNLQDFNFRAQVQHPDSTDALFTQSDSIRRLSPTYNANPNLFSTIPLDRSSWLNTYKTNTGYIGLGGISTFGASYNRQLTPSFSVSSGFYASRYNIDTYQSLTTGIQGAFSLKLNDRISLHVNGQYNTNSRLPTHPEMMALYPHTGYGGSLEIRLARHWGVIAGMERQFDVFQHKWINVPYIMPVYYK